MNEAITVPLPSLIHRIGREQVKQAQVMALQNHCTLKRVRRSRHWRLVGGAVDVQSFAAQLQRAHNADMGYLVRKLAAALLQHADKLEPLAAKLARLIERCPNITLAELMDVTQCTLVQAREARFNAEAW